jgi:glycosyltransferase involved in cell wall biosynthesis
MKIIHISFSDTNGGAARAAFRIHKCLVDAFESKKSVSEMRVMTKYSQENSVYGYSNTLKHKFIMKFYGLLNKFLKFNFQTNNKNLHSTALIKTNFLKQIKDLYFSNNKDNQIVNLHWLGNLMSIEEIGAIKNPVVWTLHDQWAFCGAEHYSDEKTNKDYKSRYIEGYLKTNRPKDESGIDINRITWERKKKAWGKPIYLICPSQWMADCAKKSLIMQNWKIKVIPYPIDTKFWRPIQKNLSRKKMNLPKDKIYIAFGAVGGTKDKRKGADLLFKAIKILGKTVSKNYLAKIVIIVFGETKSSININSVFPIKFIGNVKDDLKLRYLYSAVNLIIVPSRIDNLPQVACESQACGTPVVAFRTSGLKDIVEHKVTGCLAKPFDPKSLAFYIRWIISDFKRLENISKNSRKRAISLWNKKTIAKKYLKVYEELIESKKN